MVFHINENDTLVNLIVVYKYEKAMFPYSKNHNIYFFWNYTIDGHGFHAVTTTDLSNAEDS